MDSNNKRIAKNTVYLYIRMLITIAVSLYTSRVILDVLGLSEYGLYNVVGGTLSFFSFVNTAMSGCTQRYLNIAIGKGNEQNTKRVFSTAFTIHIALAIAFFLLMFIVGSIIVERVLVIEPSRMEAAWWVLVITLVSVCVNFMTVPFDAAIIAHERMNFYAFISIFDVTIKLLVVYALLLFKDVDKVILYSVLHLISALLTTTIYYAYCRRMFSEVSLRIRKEVKLMKEMFSFTGWSLLGNLTFMLSTQGVNIMLNMFYGSIINAAWGVATQVNGVLGRFSSSFQVASSPQIMKFYASGQYNEMFCLTRNASKYAAFLVALIGLPLFIEIDFVLSKWLVEVPEHAAFFIRFMIIQTFITASFFPVSRAIVATGKIKPSCIFDLVVRSLSLIVSFIVLKTLNNMHLAIFVQLLPSFFVYAFLLFLLKKYVDVPVSSYFSMVFLKIFIVVIVASLFPFMLYVNIEQGVLRFLLVTVVSIIMMMLSVYLFGVDKEVRKQINNYLSRIIAK